MTRCLSSLARQVFQCLRQSDLALYPYWVTQSGYSRIATTVALGMGITYGKLLYCQGVAEGNVTKKISTLEYNSRTVYDCFNDPFTDDFGSPNLHPTPINIDDIPHPHEIYQCTPYLISSAIYVASESSGSTLTNPRYSPYFLPSDDPNTLYVMKKYVLFKGRVNI